MNARQRQRRTTDDPGPDSVPGPGPGSSTSAAIDEAWRESERQRIVPPGEPPYGVCDWGDCEEYSVAWRHDPEHGYLPVCEAHRAPVDELDVAEHVLVDDDQLPRLNLGWAGYDAAISSAEARRDRSLADALARLDKATRAAYADYGKAVDAAAATFELARRAAVQAHEHAHAGQSAP